MSEKSTHRKIDWTPEDRARHKAIRERFQRERPTHEQLVASGEYAGPMPLGVYLDLKSALYELRKSREATGLSLAEVARRAGIDPAIVDDIESGKAVGTPVEILVRYAVAVGKQL